MDDGSDGRAQLQGAKAAGGDWRARVPPETRSSVVTEIMETLKMFEPVSELQGLGPSEIQKKAMQFEEMAYTAATSQVYTLHKGYWQEGRSTLMMQRQQQQQQQQQSLLRQNHMLSTQQPWMQMSPGLQSEQSTTPQPIHQPNILLQQQLRLQQLMQQSISQHGSVSGAVQQGSTLPKQEQSSRSLMCTTEPNANSVQSNAVSFEELRQKQEEFFRRHHMQREMHRQLLEKQPTAQQKSQKQQPAPMQVTQHHFENGVMNKLKDTCMVVSLLLFIGVLLVVWFMVCNGWGDLLQV